MTTHLLNDRRATFLRGLDHLSMAGKKDAFMNEVMECGGSYVPPVSAAQPANPSHLFEIALHDVNAYGATEEEAIRNWMKAATAQTSQPAPIEAEGGIAAQPPFPNPRNHAEEIANARATVPHNTARDA